MGSREIVEARRIIHEIYREGTSKCLTKIDGEYLSHMQEMIKEIGLSREAQNIEKFAYLLNFLDFFETIAFLTNSNQLQLNQVNELLNHTIVWHFSLFERWIRYRRVKMKNEKMYLEFEKLAKKLKSSE